MWVASRIRRTVHLMFLNRLQMTLPKGESEKRIRNIHFIPSETSGARGVRIRHDKDSHILALARLAHEQDDLKLCALRCGQAAELLSGEAWKCLGKTYQIEVRLKWRYHGWPPDTAAIIDTLTGWITTHKPELRDFIEPMQFLQQDFYRNLLHKGAHHDEGIGEFSRGDLDLVMTNLERLKLACHSFTKHKPLPIP